MSSKETNFSSALATWKEINLGELQKTLDKQGVQVVDGQKENLVGRKQLAEQTREFKKVPEEERGTAFKTLLKAYQGEIDALTRRSKFAESAFLSVYKLLAEAPDPFPLLDAAVEQTARASEARLLESELARQKDEIALLKQQLADSASIEKEKKKAQDKVEKLESKLDDIVLERVAAKEAELHATYDERLRNYEEREKDLTRQVTVARSQLRDLRATHDSSQAKLFDQSQRQDQETLLRIAEADQLNDDLARANGRVTEMEQRNEKLRAEIEAVRSGSEHTEKVESLEAQITDLQTETSRMIRSMEVQKESSEAEKATLQMKVDELSKEVSVMSAQVESYKGKVQQFDDYDEIKRELDIMKFVEFRGLELDEEATADSVELPNPNASKANQNRGKPLENLLVSKNKKLQEELTGLRVSYEELVATHNNLSADLDGLHTRFDEQRTLNEKLENDLLRMNEGRQVPARQDPLASLQLGRKEVPATTPPPTSTTESSILPIITSQRDRFRQRNAELEEELRRQFETISELRAEIKSLQSDNLKLYEKVRYLQSYRDEGRGSSYPPNGVRGDEEMGRYQNKYEESMNPFEAFRGRERGRAVQMLNPLEKILLSLASIVLSSRVSRNLFVLYALGLHFIVLFTLYSVVATSEVQQLKMSPI